MKSTLITGASSGIGASAAMAFSQQGHTVHLMGRDLERLKKVQAELPGESTIWACDLSEQPSVKQFCSEFCESHSELDSLVHNAGAFTPSSFEETSADEWTRQFHLSILGPATLTQGLLKLIEKSPTPSIVMVSSTLGLKPIKGASAYSALKAAMINWSQSLALELADKKIRVNCVNPGIVNTPIHDFHHANDDKVLSEIHQLQPLGRVGNPEEIAEAIWFLASEQAKWITGTSLTIDGGISLL